MFAFQLQVASGLTKRMDLINVAVEVPVSYMLFGEHKCYKMQFYLHSIENTMRIY